MTDDYYARIFAAGTKAGNSAAEAGVQAAQAYLGGRPRQPRGASRTERDLAFAASPFLRKLPGEAWGEDALTAALGRLVGQDATDVGGLLEHVARVAPVAARRAVRVSGLALRPDARHRGEVARLATLLPDEFEDFEYVLGVVEASRRRCRQRVDALRQPFAGLSPLALLIYASLYAFKHVVRQPPVPDEDFQRFWDAVNDVFAWKLETANASGFRLTERDIGKCLAEHLSPWLFPTPGAGPRADLLAAFEELMAGQFDLLEAEHATEVFCYDDAVEFVRRGDHVEFVGDRTAQAAWRTVDERLHRLQIYWHLRAMEAFANSPIANQVIGQPENHELNRVAYVSAMATELRLTEVYGVGDTVSTPMEREAPLFKTLLSRELVTAFGKSEFIQPFLNHLARTGNWAEALGALAFAGLVEGMQNRLPVTFSRREDKVRNTVGWTVDADRPRGSGREARAIVDFWTSDWGRIAERLRRGEPGLVPELFERPFLKMGQYLFELPWVSAFQNNQAAAINNLRRLGARRREAGQETRRIEERLAMLFRERGFRVLLNWQPEGDTGEVDLICARDGGILVLEVKSTFMRRSWRDVWLHRSTGLRQAAVQLRRKVPAVVADAGRDVELFPSPVSQPTVHAWIADTSVEHDHERIDGFLKVSVEELIIALRDDRGLLWEAEKVFDMDLGARERSGAGFRSEEDAGSLYADGFSFCRFREVIESESVWHGSR